MFILYMLLYICYIYIIYIYIELYHFLFKLPDNYNYNVHMISHYNLSLN